MDVFPCGGSTPVCLLLFQLGQCQRPDRVHKAFLIHISAHRQVKHLTSHYISQSFNIYLNTLKQEMGANLRHLFGLKSYSTLVCSCFTFLSLLFYLRPIKSNPDSKIFKNSRNSRTRTEPCRACENPFHSYNCQFKQPTAIIIYCSNLTII